jgi:hypothetical protein
MPHLFGLVLIGAGLYAGYRALARIAAGRTEDELRHAEVRQRSVPEKNLGKLEYDPISGVYRPVDRR